MKMVLKITILFLSVFFVPLIQMSSAHAEKSIRFFLIEEVDGNSDVGKALRSVPLFGAVLKENSVVGANILIEENEAGIEISFNGKKINFIQQPKGTFAFEWANSNVVLDTIKSTVKTQSKSNNSKEFFELKLVYANTELLKKNNELEVLLDASQKSKKSLENDLIGETRRLNRTQLELSELIETNSQLNTLLSESQKSENSLEAALARETNTLGETQEMLSNLKEKNFELKTLLNASMDKENSLKSALKAEQVRFNEIEYNSKEMTKLLLEEKEKLNKLQLLFSNQKSEFEKSRRSYSELYKNLEFEKKNTTNLSERLNAVSVQLEQNEQNFEEEISLAYLKINFLEEKTKEQNEKISADRTKELTQKVAELEFQIEDQKTKLETLNLPQNEHAFLLSEAKVNLSQLKEENTELVSLLDKSKVSELSLKNNLVTKTTKLNDRIVSLEKEFAELRKDRNLLFAENENFKKRYSDITERNSNEQNRLTTLLDQCNIKLLSGEKELKITKSALNENSTTLSKLNKDYLDLKSKVPKSKGGSALCIEW